MIKLTFMVVVIVNMCCMCMLTYMSVFFALTGVSRTKIRAVIEFDLVRLSLEDQ